MVKILAVIKLRIIFLKRTLITALGTFDTNIKIMNVNIIFSIILFSQVILLFSELLLFPRGLLCITM
jgi:hypothetical protein